MRTPLSANDFFLEHLGAVMSSCLFIGFFVVSVPVIYFMNLSASAELLCFTGLFGACHLANWPMFRVRSRLWFRGELTPYAAMVTTALLAGSFGIPFVLLVDMIQ
jgi:hypothetical protein